MSAGERFRFTNPGREGTSPNGTCGCTAGERAPQNVATELHNDPHDTGSEAWQRLVALIDEAAADGREVFAPAQDLGPELWPQILVLPQSIRRLTEVREFRLYGSNLRSIPAEIGRMTNLAALDVYTSYGLHWLPYEVTRCPNLVDSRVSRRAVYGNYEFRTPFPALPTALPPGSAPETCSVCDGPFPHDSPVLQRWITIRVATDVVPLLVNACSQECIDDLPTPPKRYLAVPHLGGIDLPQPQSESALATAAAQQKKARYVSEWAPRLEAALQLGALGDLLGSSVKGSPIERRQLDASAGALTDNTILTMATARAIVDSRTVNLRAIAKRLRALADEGHQSEASGHRATANGTAGNGTAGNGAAESGAAGRIAPVAFSVTPDYGGDRVILDVARITHRNGEAATGALAFALALMRARRGPPFDTETDLNHIAGQLPDTKVRDQLRAAASLTGIDPSDAVRQLGSSGLVVESVPLALWFGLQEWPTALAALEPAALLCEDASTVASMVGQLLGIAGHRLPEAHADPLTDYDTRGIAESLAAIGFVWPYAPW